MSEIIPDAKPGDPQVRFGNFGHIRPHGKTLEVALWYPGLPHEFDRVEVSLDDVRAADSLLISYDFDRDGWNIKQASQFGFEVDDKVCDPDWQEVAFVRAWAREVKPPEMVTAQTSPNSAEVVLEFDKPLDEGMAGSGSVKIRRIVPNGAFDCYRCPHVGLCIRGAACFRSKDEPPDYPGDGTIAGLFKDGGEP